LSAASCTGPAQILEEAPFSACGTPEEEEEVVDMVFKTFFKHRFFFIIFAISNPFFLGTLISEKIRSGSGVLSFILTLFIGEVIFQLPRYQIE
jgi:hypothetical protein